MKRKLYTLTPDDLEIFELARTDASWFTGYYMRTPVEAKNNEVGWRFDHNIDPPWQKAMNHATQGVITIIGGMGTLDINSRIYDAELEKYVSVKWLIQNKRRPVVLSKTNIGWAKIRASEPYYEGTENLYRVTTKAGRTIDVGAGHRFLTTRGFVRTCDLLPGEQLIVPDNLPAIVQNDDADVPRRSEIASGCFGGYSGYSHQCDAQLHRASNTAQAFAPLHSDECGSTHSIQSDPDILSAPALPDSRPVHYAGHSHTPHCTRLHVLHRGKELAYHDRAANVAPVRTESATQVLSKSWPRTNPAWKDVLVPAHTDLDVMASSFSETGHIVWSYTCSKSADSSKSVLFQDDMQLLPEYRADLQGLAASLGLANSSFDETSIPLDNDNWWNLTTTDTIISVKWTCVHDIYDIHVPFFNNYVAEGMVNHNSGKTGAVAMSGLYWTTVLPDFRFLCVAPTQNQATQMYKYISTNIAGTLFEQRFIARESTGGNNPVIYIDYKLPDGTPISSTMEFLSAADDAERIKNIEVDMVVLDQAEMILDLIKTIAVLGTRARGLIRGRHRLGRVVIIANADDSPELWSMADMDVDNPKTHATFLVSTYSNKNLTPEQLRQFELLLGDDPVKIDQYLHGKRPMGEGIEFSENLLKKCWDETLDSIMVEALSRQDESFIYTKDPGRKADCIHWEMPAEKDRIYYVVGDPGTGGPPARNAPCVMVFDVTGYPDAPATLRAFWWGNGAGKYEPFLNKMHQYMAQYHCMFGGYDSTAGQKVLSETSFSALNNMIPVDMGGSKKKSYITLFKLAMDRNRLKLPIGIKGMNYQLLKYRLPDDKLPQDIVATFLVFFGLLWFMGFNDDIEKPEEHRDEYDGNSTDRHSRTNEDRDTRTYARY